MAAEKFTEFDYLLNAMTHAGQEKYPAKAGYAGKRQALMAHVRELERKAALWDAINGMWSFPGRTLEEVVCMVAAERTNGVDSVDPPDDSDIELPPLPASWKGAAHSMQGYAREAVLRDRARRSPGVQASVPLALNEPATGSVSKERPDLLRSVPGYSVGTIGHAAPPGFGPATAALGVTEGS